MQFARPLPSSAGLQASVLIVADETAFGRSLKRALRPHTSLVEAARNFEQADVLRERCLFDVIILDISQRADSAIQWLAGTQAIGHRSQAIVVSDRTNARLVLDAMHAGAVDFVEKTRGERPLVEAVRRIPPRRHQAPRPSPAGDDVRIDALVGRSTAMQKLREQIIRLAPSPVTVLIQGETGTGKELVARTLHELSERQGEFVAVNCSAISPEIIESELFGHVRGAFTSAFSTRQGLFHFAREGTLFLDEISEMPWEMQSKLLRALEERTIRPVGAERELPVNVRVICATNRDMSQLVASGKFRQDLYYRIDVVAVHIPPLRERLEDLSELSHYLGRCLTDELGMAPLVFSGEDLDRMRRHNWPGNVRELRNTIERGLLLGQLPDEFCQLSGSNSVGHAPWPSHLTLAEIEKHHVLRVLEEVKGNKSEAARRLGVSRKTLERKVKAWTTESSR